jgi:malonyl CoA-acyl carrier protein transacylase
MACENTGQILGLPSLFPTIFRSEPITDIVHHHYILFSIQYACAKSWIDAGLRVDRMIGHSFGQLTALCISGTLSLSDSIRLVTHRARLIQTHWGLETGVMLAIEATEQQVRELLLRIDKAPDVACVNSNRNVVIAGDETSIQAIEELDSTYRMKRLANTHAFHSRLVDSIMPAFTTVAESLEFKPPSIPIEACTMLPEDWSSVTPKQIVEHSRNAVYFKNAVERVAAQTKHPSLWLEAGSGSPVISLVRRVLDSHPPSSKGHVYQSTDLSGALGPRNLANATSSLWSSGFKVQFWPFHSSQSCAYDWHRLPPYQFAKTSHWVDYDPTAFNVAPVEAQPLDRSSDLVKVLESATDKFVFKVNTNHDVYQKCTRGHAVVDQSLCPASMYMDMVATAATTILHGDSSESMFVFEDLVISSPLVLEPQSRVLITLSRVIPEKNQWVFVLLSENADDQTNFITHSTGKIALHPFDKPAPVFSRFDHFGRLVAPDREKIIANTPMLNGLLGKMVYQSMDRVTVYADYYRGVQKVLANSHEAIGRVNLSNSLTKDRACDPILLDNFLQVAGIHVNCLSEHKADEVYVCSSVSEVLLGQPFMKRDKRDSSSWLVYTNYSRQSQTRLASDIFVMDEQTGALALVILGVGFTSLSIRALTRTLARLNNSTEEPMSQPAPIILPNIKLSLPNGHQTPPSTPPISESGVSDNGVLHRVQEMLCELLGVPVDEVAPSASLNDIGVDSLMSTEVISEIKKRFNVSLSNSDFAQMLDVHTLVRFILQPNMPVQPQEADFQPEPEPEPVHMDGHASPQHKTLLNGNAQTGVAPLAQRNFTTSRFDISFGAKTKWNGFCRVVHPRQMALVTAYVVEAFQSLGVRLDTFSPGQAVPMIPVIPRHEKLRTQLYGILEYSQLVNQGKRGDFYRTETPVPTTTSTTLHEKILLDFPQHESEHRLLHKTGPHLAACLSGDADGLSLIFKNAEALRLVEDVYTLAPNFKSSTMHLTQYLSDIVAKFTNQRNIKILEIGAGTGGTTKYLLNQLTTIPGVRLQYTFTDISSSLVKLARKKFQMYDFMHYTTLDISKAPPADLQGQFDIVLSSNCIHATRNLAESCTNIRKLLRPDGILCLIELTSNLYWYDLVFGLLEGWWLFEDGRQHALSSAEHWDQILRQSGYKWVDWTRNHLAESDILRVIVASPFEAQALVDEEIPLATQETIIFGQKDGVQLSADIYYPKEIDYERPSRPIGR